MNKIRIHRPINQNFWPGLHICLESKVVFEYDLPTFNVVRSGEETAELVFHITNAPEELLSEEELKVANAFRAKDNYSLSTGDVVEVDGDYFLCEPAGWRQIDDIKAA